MKTFDVQSVQIETPFQEAVGYISDAAKLPEWASAFQSVDGCRARMATPAGSVDVDLRVDVCTEDGSIDWTMTFPDKSTARAFSRVVPLSPRSVVYTFVLTPPPVPLEQLEGALDRQSATLRQELDRLRQILEK
ncbi:MAG TPA: hypothetical protein VEU96_33065 [Bryobacteraceae bacterium]|nr:hypothetical protein [Bryobacteraceae bacterium]